MVSYLILFLVKTPRGSLPVLSAHSLANNRKSALLESAEEGFLSRNGIFTTDARVDIGTALCKADMLQTKLPCLVFVLIYL